LPHGVDLAGAKAIRDWDRGLLWSTIGGGGGGGARPAPGDTAPLVDAAIAHVARTPAALVVVPLEDLLGEVEQPNLPGTTHEHPNWQRRLPAPMDDLLDRAACKSRLESLSARA
jgi:4-alpha-glucanotransferase